VQFCVKDAILTNITCSCRYVGGTGYQTPEVHFTPRSALHTTIATRNAPTRRACSFWAADANKICSQSCVNKSSSSAGEPTQIQSSGDGRRTIPAVHFDRTLEQGAFIGIRSFSDRVVGSGKVNCLSSSPILLSLELNPHSYTTAFAIFEALWEVILSTKQYIEAYLTVVGRCHQLLRQCRIRPPFNPRSFHQGQEGATRFLPTHGHMSV
jgi:hypothetical protein